MSFVRARPCHSFVAPVTSTSLIATSKAAAAGEIEGGQGVRPWINGFAKCKAAARSCPTGAPFICTSTHSLESQVCKPKRVS